MTAKEVLCPHCHRAMESLKAVEITEMVPGEERPLPAPTKHAAEKITVGTNPNVTFDTQSLGKKMAFLLLCRGDDLAGHKQCLGELISTVPLNRRSIHIVGDNLSEKSVDFFQTVLTNKIVDSVDIFSTISRFAALRFYANNLIDQENTRWTIFWDDSVRLDGNLGWFNSTLTGLSSSVTRGIGMFGQVAICKYTPDQMRWIKARPWYNKLQFQAANAQPAPDGDSVFYPLDDNFGICNKLLLENGVPDENLEESGMPVIAEQARQAGLQIAAINRKALVVDKKMPGNWLTA